jgi:LuxR family maltose regulon positive regulatory protein
VGYVENGLARLLYEWDDLEAARERFEAAIRVGRLHAHGPVLVSAYTGLAWLCQAQGDAAEAVELLRQAEVVARSARTAGAGRRVGASQARVWLAQGDVERAGRWLVEADLPLDATPGYAREREQLTGARVLLAQGRADGALALLEGLRQRAEAEGRLGSLIEILALQALARGALGDRAAAVGLLERALVLAGPAGYVRTFVDEGPALAALLAEAGTSSVEDAYLARVRASFARPWRRPASGERRGPISPPARSAPRLVEPLTDREREVLALIAAGESNREIADRLVVSVGTVKKHGNNIFGNLGVGRRTQAIARARALGLL